VTAYRAELYGAAVGRTSHEIAALLGIPVDAFYGLDVELMRHLHGLPPLCPPPCVTCDGEGMIAHCCEQRIGPYQWKCCGDPILTPCPDCAAST
jgi:hypothetical protein